MQLMQGAKIIAQLFWMWFYVQLWHAACCNNCRLSNMLHMKPRHYVF